MSVVGDDGGGWGWFGMREVGGGWGGGGGG